MLGTVLRNHSTARHVPRLERCGGGRRRGVELGVVRGGGGARLEEEAAQERAGRRARTPAHTAFAAAVLLERTALTRAHIRMCRAH